MGGGGWQPTHRGSSCRRLPCALRIPWHVVLAGGRGGGLPPQQRRRDALPDDVVEVTELKKHTKQVTCLHYDPHTQQVRCAACARACLRMTHDACVQLLQTQGPRSVATRRWLTRVVSLCVCRCVLQLYSGSSDGSICAWSCSTGQVCVWGGGGGGGGGRGGCLCACVCWRSMRAALTASACPCMCCVCPA
jgi:hypothetical protein